MVTEGHATIPKAEGTNQNWYLWVQSYGWNLWGRSAPRLLWVYLQREEIGLQEGGNRCHQEEGPLLGQSRQEKEKQEGSISFLSLFYPPISSSSYWWKLSGTQLKKQKFCFQSLTSESENKLEKVWMWSRKTTCKWHFWFIPLLRILRLIRNFRWFHPYPSIIKFPINVSFNGFSIHWLLLPTFIISFGVTKQQFSDFSIFVLFLSGILSRRSG